MSSLNQSGSTLGSLESPFSTVYASVTQGNLAGSILFSAVNNTGSTIEAHKIVSINDVVNGIPQISLSSANLSSLQTLGLTQSSIDNGVEGYVISLGNIEGIDTSSFSVGDVLYASTTPGSFTSIKPQGNDVKIQPIGIVIKSNVNGIIRVMPTLVV